MFNSHNSLLLLMYDVIHFKVSPFIQKLQKISVIYSVAKTKYTLTGCRLQYN